MPCGVESPLLSHVPRRLLADCIRSNLAAHHSSPSRLSIRPRRCSSDCQPLVQPIPMRLGRCRGTMARGGGERRVLQPVGGGDAWGQPRRHQRANKSLTPTILPLEAVRDGPDRLPRRAMKIVRDQYIPFIAPSSPLRGRPESRPAKWFSLGREQAPSSDHTDHAASQLHRGSPCEPIPKVCQLFFPSCVSPRHQDATISPIPSSFRSDQWSSSTALRCCLMIEPRMTH